MKTIEFACTLSSTQKTIVDGWLESLRWVWNEALGLLLELEAFTYWDKVSASRVDCCPIPWEYRWWKDHEDSSKWHSAAFCPIANRKRNPYRMFCPLPQDHRIPRIDNTSAFTLTSYFAHKNHEDKSWLIEVPSVFIRGVLQSLAAAWTEYKKKKREIPRFKGKAYPLQTLVNNDAKSITIRGEVLRVPKLGEFRVKGLTERWAKDPFGLPIPICTLKLCCRPSGSYLQLTGEVPSTIATPKRTRTVGIALIGAGIHHVTDTGKTVTAPRYLAKSLKKLAKLQQKLSRQVYLSQNWQKTKLKIGKLHERIKAQRNKFNHKLSTYIVRTYKKIAIQKIKPGAKPRPKPRIVNGKYAPNGARERARKNLYMSDLASGQFVDFIKQKAKVVGCDVVEVETNSAKAHKSSKKKKLLGVIVEEQSPRLEPRQVALKIRQDLVKQ